MIVDCIFYGKSLRKLRFDIIVEIMSRDIDTRTLMARILGFLGLEMQWIASARQIWLLDVESRDVVTVFMELHDGSLVEKPLEVERENVLLNVEIDGEDVAERAFFESLGMIRKFSYGMDIETLEPKKILSNPFFKLGSLEEIAIKLDLLDGERKR